MWHMASLCPPPGVLKVVGADFLCWKVEVLCSGSGDEGVVGTVPKGNGTVLGVYHLFTRVVQECFLVLLPTYRLLLETASSLEALPHRPSCSSAHLPRIQRYKDTYFLAGNPGLACATATGDYHSKADDTSYYAAMNL